jgi:hypothetical protein
LTLTSLMTLMTLMTLMALMTLMTSAMPISLRLYYQQQHIRNNGISSCGKYPRAQRGLMEHIRAWYSERLIKQF